MNIRYHAWMNRSLNGERFSAAEHALYTACALGFGIALLGSFAIFFKFPSIATFLVVMLAAAGALWVMAANNRYCANLPPANDPK